MTAPLDFETALKGFQPISAPPISLAEHEARICSLQQDMRRHGIAAVWLDASSSLTYFTGLQLGLSERIHGAIIPLQGPPIYISPAFEEPKLRSLLLHEAPVAVWEEDEDPYALIAAQIAQTGVKGALALDPATPYLFAARLIAAHEGETLSAQPLITALRQVKSPSEIALIQTAMTASWQVQRAVHAGLREGMTTTEVCDFIADAHRAFGLAPLFAAAQFGEATAYPHGVPHPQKLRKGDMVLIDLGAILHGYRSDITRCYVFGTPTPRQRQLWTAEREAHAAAFAAAKIGATAESVDLAARKRLEAAGFGPGYKVPGLPHRTGHGLGLDIHEEPFIVKGNQTLLEAGMCFSIEPMLCLYGECGIRLEDIVFMDETGPKFFAPPALDLDDPFGGAQTAGRKARKTLP